MSRPKPQQVRTEVNVGMDEKLRELLEKAARRSCRSLSGEVVFRLRNSFEPDNGDSQAAA
jgi:hypothetical protein